jgi:hypothetical protein
LFPDYDRVIECVRRVAGIDKEQAEDVWTHESGFGGALQGVVAIRGPIPIRPDVCRSAGITIYSGEPPPVGPDIMQHARAWYCEKLAGLHESTTPVPDFDPAHLEQSRKAIADWVAVEEPIEDAAFASPLHISKEQAHAALERAAGEQSAGLFVCEGATAVAKSDEEVWEAAERAARRAICSTVQVPLSPPRQIDDVVVSQATIDTFKEDPDSKDWIAEGKKPEELLKPVIWEITTEIPSKRSCHSSE